MNGISCQVILTGASTRVDGSLGLRFCTPELRPDEKTSFMELQGVNLEMVLKPADEATPTIKEVKSPLSTKSQSERIRGTLFVWYKQLGEPGKWETFYRHETEKYLEQIKAHLKPTEPF